MTDDADKDLEEAKAEREKHHATAEHMDTIIKTKGSTSTREKHRSAAKAGVEAAVRKVSKIERGKLEEATPPAKGKPSRRRKM